MNGLCKEIIKELEEARFYKALSKIKELKTEGGVTTDLLMLLYFTYDLMFFMSKHQNIECTKYERLRNYYLYKLETEIKARDSVYLNLSIFLYENFTTAEWAVWFDKNNEVLDLVNEALTINSNNQEAIFYKQHFSGKTSECVDLLLTGNFETKFIDNYLSKISFNRKSTKEKAKLLEGKYKPEGNKIKLFIRYYSWAEEYEKAYHIFDNNPQLKESTDHSFYNFGRVCMELDKYDEALIFFRKQEETEQNHIEIAKCYERLNNNVEAINYYKKACVNFTSGKWADAPDGLIRLEAYNDLKEVLNDIEGNNRLFQADLKVYQAQLLHINGEYKKSLQKLDAAVRLFEKRHQEKSEKWYLYQALNNFELSIDWMQKNYERIIEKKDFNLKDYPSMTYEHFSSYHGFQKDMKKLNLKYAYKYLTQEKELEDKILNRYYSLNREVYKKSKELKFKLDINIELFYLSLFDEEDELDKRISIHKSRLDTDPNNPQYHLNIGGLLATKKDYSGAERHLKLAIKLAEKYFFNLNGVPELSLIRINNEVNLKDNVDNNELFNKSMGNYITHNSSEASHHTIFFRGVLHKYQSLSINTISSLTNDYMFFSESKNFNDPFDVNTHLIGKLFDDNVDIDNDLFKSFSLAMNNYNPLMWSHYADEHKGICIGYEFDYLPPYVGKGKIKYKETLLKENKTFNALDDYWLTKGDDWEYEEEVRLLHFGYKNKITYCFNKKQALKEGKISVKIKEIVLGLKFEKSNEKILQLIVEEIEKRQNQKINILRANKDEDHPLKLTIR